MDWLVKVEFVGVYYGRDPPSRISVMSARTALTRPCVKETPANAKPLNR